MALKEEYILGILAVLGVAGVYYVTRQSGPQSFVSPQSGGPGTNYILTGQGFPPNTTQTFNVIGANGIGGISFGNVIIKGDGTFTPIGIAYSTVGGTGVYKVVWSQSPSANTSYLEQ